MLVKENGFYQQNDSAMAKRSSKAKTRIQELDYQELTEKLENLTLIAKNIHDKLATKKMKISDNAELDLLEAISQCDFRMETVAVPDSIKNDMLLAALG